MKNKGPGSSYTRAGWVHFDVSGKTYGEEATLEFTVDIASSSGVIDVWAVCPMGPMVTSLESIGVRVVLPTTMLQQNPDFTEGAQMTYLGSFDASSTASGSTCQFSNAALLSFLQSDTNGEVNLRAHA